MISAEQAVLSAILLCLLGAVATLLVSRSRGATGWLAFGATLGTALVVLWAVAKVLAGGPSAQPAQFWAMPRFGFALRLHVDGLSAVYLALAAVLAVLASLYSITYMRHYPGESVARYYPHFLLFLAAMYGLVCTTDMMWFFFIFWQMMTLPGYALIRFERKKANIRAANKFLLMMQVACAATMLGAELLAVTGASATGSATLKYDFDTVSGNLPVLLREHPQATALAFALFLAGFGIKMGMWPFGQVWLPDAHPAAPSPVSALLSGVMIKTGVYGLMRYFLWLVPPAGQGDYPHAAWGLVIAVLGTITLFTGTMQALRQEQSKRLLAFHSIGQIGYILLGTGACLALLPAGGVGAAGLAAVGFAGALGHVVNHGIFKALLFLNAGSILHATGTQDLNKMGGLIRFMPWTALTTLVAAFSISGVPLLNGFVSKWSIYVAAIQGNAVAGYLGICALIAILTSALTLASFIKFFGVAFLSRQSGLVSAQAAKGRLEVGWSMQVPQVLLAMLCLGIGLVPAWLFRLTQGALNVSRQGYGTALAEAEALASGAWRGLEQVTAAASFAPLLLAAVLGLTFLLARVLAKLGRARRRATVPWLCGYVQEEECHRYGAHQFYGEVKRRFRWLGGTTRSPSEPTAKEP